MIPKYRLQTIKSLFTLIVCLMLVLVIAPVGLAEQALDDPITIHLPLLLKHLTYIESKGVLDPAFDGDGWATLNFGSFLQAIYGIAIQPDGKIVVAGYADGVENEDCVLARYNPDGSLDSSFDGDGKLVTDIGNEDNTCRAIALQVDGKIVAAGWAFNGLDYDIALMRYNPDGSLDTSFSGDGIQVTDFVSSDQDSRAIVIQQDGKIVVVGTHFGTTLDIVLARYNPDGSLDSTFDGDGKLLTDVAGNDFGNAIALQPDGKIVVGGYSSEDFAVARYNSNGSLDSSFDGDGKLVTDFLGGGDWIFGLILQPDGKIVVSGSAFNGSNTDFAVARYNPDGSLDTSFSGDGKLMTDFSSVRDEAYAIARQENGKIVVAGFAHNGEGTDFALARYNLDGSLDSTFDSDGMLMTDFNSDVDSSDSANAIALQPDGKIVAAGSTYIIGVGLEFIIARYK